MQVSIKQIDNPFNECVTIECVKITNEVTAIETYVKSLGDNLTGWIGDRIYTFSLVDVMYFEAVDERLFAYTIQKTFELKNRLYEIEELYKDKWFFRCSKSFIINLLAVLSVSPALNGRFTAHMKNHQKIIISRQYVKQLKVKLQGGNK